MSVNGLLKKKEQPKQIQYRDGGEGMIKWCDDKVRLPIYPPGSEIAIWWPLGDLPTEKNPKTNRSYQDLWEFHKKVLREALQMDDTGQFIYRLIVFCWMRGEGKSILAVLIQLWKFFCWPRQLITLGANSKDQIKFVHFEWMRDIILNSPELLKDIGGSRNVKEKDIILKDSKGRQQSSIRPISTATGIVSNITGYTFSEIFAMKKPDFFTQLDGSIRNIPNALGVIDSTVSPKKHVLYQLYSNVLLEKTKTVYFSYRCSPTGSYEDFFHPGMSQDQLDDYEIKFPFGEFDKYFKNTWSSGSNKIFPAGMVEEMSIIGTKESFYDHTKIKDVIDKKEHLIDMRTSLEQQRFDKTRGLASIARRIGEQMDLLVPVDSLYTLADGKNRYKSATLDDLRFLTDKFDTDWSILAGADFGDPYATTSFARSIGVVFAKGLPGSKSDPTMYLRAPTAPQYIYFLLVLSVSNDHSINSIKESFEYAHDEFLGIDSLCCEHYGAWDIGPWCEDREIEFLAVHPNYEKQKDCFKALLECGKEGRIKFPSRIGIEGSKSNNILTEELEEFDHDIEKKWFGSTEKGERNGIQDDVVYSIGWSLYGGRFLGVDSFRIRTRKQNFGEMSIPKGLLGVYT